MRKLCVLRVEYNAFWKFWNHTAQKSCAHLSSFYRYVFIFFIVSRDWVCCMYIYIYIYSFSICVLLLPLREKTKNKRKRKTEHDSLSVCVCVYIYRCVKIILVYMLSVFFFKSFWTYISIYVYMCVKNIFKIMDCE